MRLVSAFLFVALTGSSVLADEAKPADPKHELTKRKVPYRVVKLLPETRQVLLLDRIHGTHVVAEVGQSLDGYYVDDIDAEEVTLLGDNGAQVILTAPPPPRASRRPAKTAPAPDDAYGDASEATDAPGPAPIDPYAEPEAPSVPGEGGVRVASAGGSSPLPAPPSATGFGTTTTSPAPASGSSRVVSAAQGTSSVGSSPASPPPPILDDDAPDASDPYGNDPGIAAFADAVGATPAPTTPAKPATSTKQPASTEDAASALAAAATGSPVAPPASNATASGAPSGTSSASGATSVSAATATIARAELDAALADFGRLAGSFRATFTPDGVRFDTIRDGTLLTKIGLRKGDVVTYVDGQPLRSLDDAANLYARAATVRSTTLQVVRDGKLVTLRVAIQ